MRTRSDPTALVPPPPIHTNMSTGKIGKKNCQSPKGSEVGSYGFISIFAVL